MGKSFRDTTDDGLPIFKKQQDSVTEDGLPILKKKDSGVSPTSSVGTGGDGLSPLGGGPNPFSYGALTKKPDEDKNRWVKAPLPIAKAVQEDKKKDTGTVGYVFNSIVDGVAEVIGGVPDAINAITDAGDDLIDRAHGTPGLSKYIRKSGGSPGLPPRLPEGQEVVKGMQHLFGVSTSYKPPEFDVTEGVQASDIESLAVQAPRQLMDMVYGAYTGGGSFFLQSVNQNAKELSENPNAAKLSPTERLGYLYLQGGIQMAWDKLSLGQITKATGLSQKVKQKIANEITDELIKKGQKATAKEVEQLALAKASSFATQVKKVGLKAATSFGAEAGTEAAQQASSDGIKLLTNKMSGSEIFDEKDITTNFVKNVINSGAQGGVFGAGAGTGVGVMQNTKKALRNEIAKATTPEDIQKMQANIAEQIELGNISPEEAEAANITAQQYAEVAATIPETIDAEKKYALIGGIEQREELKREIAKVNEEMSAIDPAFHEDYIAQTDLLNAKLNQTNDYIDGIATGKKHTYRKEGDVYIKTDSKGETPISKEHYELATAIREEDAANNKMAEEVSKQEIKAAKILGKATLPDIMIAAAEENPIGFVKTIAQQAQNLKEDGTPFNDGMEEASLMATETTFGKEAVAEAIKLYPKKEAIPSMETTAEEQQEGATKGVVPSTLKEDAKSDIDFIAEKTGLKFDKSKDTNSWYGKGGDRAIRISDHPSKFTEKQKSLRGEENALDLNFNYYSKEAIVHLINNTDPFTNFKNGDKITHSSEKIGEVTYLNSDYKKGYVEVITKDGRTVKYDMEKFLGKGNDLNNQTQQQSTPTNEAKETTQVPDQAETTVTEPAKPDKAGSEAKKSVLERPIEEVTIEDILKEMEGDEGLAFKEVSNKDIKEGDGKDIEAYNQRAERVLKTLYPNAEFKALSTTKEYEQATGRKGEAGVLIRGKDGKHQLFLNLEAIINSDIERTATHEVVHALVSDAIGAKYVDLRKKWDSLLPKLYSVKGFEIVKEHIEKYSSADRPVEGITDLLANIVHGKIKIEDVPKNLWDEFIELVNRAFEAIGIDYKITPDTFNGFASSVKEAFETGDFRNLKKFTAKSKTEKFFKEYPQFAESASAMIDPERRKQLEELLKTKIQQELNQGKINKNQANEFYRKAGIEPPTVSVTAEGEGGDRKGITHAAVAVARERVGLPEYEGKPVETHQELLAEARATIAANPNAANEVMQKMDRNEEVTNKDNAILAVYKGSLDAELEVNPSRELYDRISRLAKVLDPSGTKAGKLLESRKLFTDNGDSLSNFLLEKEAAQGAPLTDNQLKSEAAKYQELKDAKEKLEKQLEEERAKHAKDIAELGVNKAKAKARKENKKTDAEYKKERVELKKSIKEKWEAAGKDILSSDIPFRKQLAAIAPDVKKMMQNIIDNGVDRFDDIITDLHAELKDVIDGIKKSQIIDIIAGDYDEVKDQTRNEKANSARLLKREAELIKELAAARKGEEKAKSEKEKTASTRRIDELKEKIKEVRALNKESKDVEPAEDLTAGSQELLSKEEKRLQAKIEKLTKDLKEGNYLKEPEKKPVFAKSRKAQIMEDRVIDLENKIRHERSKDEYEKRSKWRKGFDYVMQVLGVKRLVQTAVDMSTSFRQGATLIGPRNIDVWAKGFQANLKSIFNPKKFERIMYAIRHDQQYHDMVKDGIVFNDLGSADPDLHNEDFRKSFLYNIPILSEPLKASNRSADAFLNVARYELYKKMRRRLEQQGLTRESDPKAFKYAGGWIMNMTGRGNMHSALEKPAMNAVLGNTFYGARLMASRFNILNPVTYFDPRVPKAAKVEAMKDMASFTVTVMAAGLALVAAGGSVSLDPDDPDFLQVRFGDKVYDISGGLATYVRTFLRMVKAGYTKATGNKYEGRKATEKAGQSALMFFRNKLSPNTAYATDAFFGKAYGQEFDASEIYAIYPMYADDAIEAYQGEGLMSIPTVLLPNILGIGYGNYGSRGQIDATLEDLLKRNMRSSEMNSEKIRNFKDDGRPITNDEFDEYADKRDAEIEKDIKVLYEKGILGVPYKELTKEEVADETSYIKAAATRKVKEEMFGKQKKTSEEKRADRKLSKEREEKYKKN